MGRYSFGPSFLFFPTFFLPFLVFFVKFIIFCFFFFDVFNFLFSFFQKAKVSSFLFSCISFKYFLLLALVSEFNCFLCSRCSMEIWCPDDIGRDNWDWGRLPGRERASAPQSGVEAPRLLKRSLPRLYCCCCFFGLDRMTRWYCLT